MTTDNQMTANGTHAGDHPAAQIPAPTAPPPAPHAGPAEGGKSEGTPKPGTANDGTAKPGAPAHNANRATTYKHTTPEGNAVRIALGSLPASMKRVERHTLEFRRMLENEVLKAKGAIGLLDAALVESACRWHRHAALCLRWLRLHEKDMSHAERLSYSRAIADAGTSRDRCLERLNLDVATGDLWAAYDAHLARQRAANASNGHVGDGGQT
jgi:hypothetical protein